MLGGRGKKRQGRGFSAKNLQPHSSLVQGRSDGRGRPAQPHFSLQDEARNTERHGNWVAEQKLRHSKVKFISAGNLHGEGVTEERPIQEATSIPTIQGLSADDRPSLELSMTRLTLGTATDGPSSMPSEISHSDFGRYVKGHKNAGETSGSFKGNGADEGQPFIFDGRKNENIEKTGFSNPKPQSRSPSPVSSASSEDIVVFRGRKNLRTKSQPVEALKKKPTVLEDPFPPQKTINPVERSVMLTTNTPPVTSAMHPLGMNGKCTSARRRARKASVAYEMDDSILKDYVANIDPDDPLAALATGLASDLPHSHKPLVPLANGRTQNKTLDHRKSESDWDTSDLEDFNNISTSEAASSEVRKIIAKRKRLSGTQYLVVFVGLGSDDARWMPIERLQTITARELVGAFEDSHTEKLAAQHGSYESDQSTESVDPADVGSRRQMDEMLEEENLVEMRKEKMTDEQIARILAKQEELGLGSEEVLLFDGVNGTNFEENYLEFGASVSKQRNRKGKSRGAKYGLCGHAETHATTDLFENIQPTDPYGGFDVMDFERPSLQKKRKGRQEAFDFDLSDSDLAMQMAATWKNDRTKKKLRKVERQLQKELSQSTARGESPAGMEIADVKRQLVMFLHSERPSISFPPMNKGDRRAIHEIANRLNLTSKSQGTGHKRFPVLHRTKRTSHVTEDQFNRIVEQLSRRFRSLRGGKMPQRAKILPQGRGGYSHAAVSCRDGEVVGAGAAELGHENRGRAMLEKMGWSAGTAIGALNNKGIMQPVAHVVKTTKAGLG